MLGSACTLDTGGKPIASTCSWKAVDSPQENIAVYQRILKYGHLQTDPREVDPAAGDPALPTSYRPALDAADRAKFTGKTVTLLPGCGGAPVPTDGSPWNCAQPESLTAQDFGFLAGTLAAAADKTGDVTADLIQYFNRIVRVDKQTEYTVPALHLLPALYRPSSVNTDPLGEGTPAGIKDDTGVDLYVGNPDLPFPANEQFLDFASSSYKRSDWFNTNTEVIKPTSASATAWLYDANVPIQKYLEFANPWWKSKDTNTGITGFVFATEDSLRTTEFFHNYAVPLNLGWNFKY